MVQKECSTVTAIDFFLETSAESHISNLTILLFVGPEHEPFRDINKLEPILSILEIYLLHIRIL